MTVDKMEKKILFLNETNQKLLFILNKVFSIVLMSFHMKKKSDINYLNDLYFKPNI